MSHVQHIAQNKEVLERRFEIIKNIRSFFSEQDFIEVETPLIVGLPGQEPNLSPIQTTVHDEQGVAHTGYLHTSPEYTMKKMIAAGFSNIFFLGKCFRDKESFGGLHNPEFTMIEWYRTDVDMFSIMDDVESLLIHLGYKGGVVRMHMNEVWKKYAKVDLREYLDVLSLRELCVNKGYAVTQDETYEELFYRIFLNEIEPKLKDIGAVMIHHYPAQMAALSKLSDDTGYAQRFELYIDGVEIANAFSELTDSQEQLKRLEEEREERKRQGKRVYAIDSEFIDALKTIPTCAGIALGIDRLVQVLTGCENIDNVLVLPMSKIF